MNKLKRPSAETRHSKDPNLALSRPCPCAPAASGRRAGLGAPPDSGMEAWRHGAIEVQIVPGPDQQPRLRRVQGGTPTCWDRPRVGSPKASGRHLAPPPQGYPQAPQSGVPAHPTLLCAICRLRELSGSCIELGRQSWPHLHVRRSRGRGPLCSFPVAVSGCEGRRRRAASHRASSNCAAVHGVAPVNGQARPCMSRGAASDQPGCPRERPQRASLEGHCPGLAENNGQRDQAGGRGWCPQRMPTAGGRLSQAQCSPGVRSTPGKAPGLGAKHPSADLWGEVGAAPAPAPMGT